MGTDDVAVRLADEGVPLCAIARATGTPSGEVRERLELACAEGRLIDLPKGRLAPRLPPRSARDAALKVGRDRS